MWPFTGGKIAEQLNTVDLNDDFDDVEMFLAIERTFKFHLQKSEAEQLVTVGDLYELVKRRMPSDGSVDLVWEVVEQIVRSYSNSSYAIDTKTTFFPKFAQPRERIDDE